MDRGFFTILSSQFLSALADNALFIAAVFLLKQQAAPEWQISVLLCCFTVSYVILAPFAGSFADSMHKSKAMMICNGIKLIGCLGLLVGVNPLFSYAVVGFGAAAYSPAKYGIITEYVPAERLVAANGWLEGATVTAIIVGTALGGILISPDVAHTLHTLLPITQNYCTAQIAIALITLIYLSAAWLNLYIPKLAVVLKPLTLRPLKLIREFAGCVGCLWRDPQGRLSLAVTTFLWGVGATMRLVVINWAIIWLLFDLEHATQLVVVVAMGTTVGALIAGKTIPLPKAFTTLPMGVIIGLLVTGIVTIHNIWIAVVFMLLIGALCGYLVVPLNAMLQYRGYQVMGTGHSIAVQNFSENLGILFMVGLHGGLVKYLSSPVPSHAHPVITQQFAHSGGLPPMYLIIIGGGLLFASVMLWAIWQSRKIGSAGVK